MRKLLLSALCFVTCSFQTNATIKRLQPEPEPETKQLEIKPDTKLSKKQEKVAPYPATITQESLAYQQAILDAFEAQGAALNKINRRITIYERTQRNQTTIQMLKKQTQQFEQECNLLAWMYDKVDAQLRAGKNVTKLTQAWTWLHKQLVFHKKRTATVSIVTLIIVAGVIYGVYSPATVCTHFPETACQAATYVHEWSIAAGTSISAAFKKMYAYAHSFLSNPQEAPSSPSIPQAIEQPAPPLQKIAQPTVVPKPAQSQPVNCGARFDPYETREQQKIYENEFVADTNYGCPIKLKPCTYRQFLECPRSTWRCVRYEKPFCP